MKPLLIACVATAWAVVASGCSGGDAGPASRPFNPFGTETTSSTGVEPTVSGTDPGPGNSGGGEQTIGELCVTVCAHIDAACPGGSGTDCVASCSSAAPAGCDGPFRTFLLCVSPAPIACSNGSASISSCQTEASAVSACISQQGAGA